MLGALVLVFVTISFIYYLLKNSSTKKLETWEKLGVKVLQNDVTLVQMFTGKRSHFDFDIQHYEEIGTEKFGINFEFGTPHLLVKDLDLIKLIMVKDFDHFTDHMDFIDTDPLWSKSLFFMHGQEWKDMRSFLSPTFTSGKIRRMFHNFDKSSKKLLQYINTQHTKVDGGFEVFLAELMARYTVDVIGANAFGMETDVLTNNNSLFYTMAKRSSEMSTKRLIKFGLFTTFPQVGNFFKMQAVDKDCSDFFYKILSQALKRRDNSEEQREDFLQLLTEAKQGRLTDEASTESKGDVKEDNLKKPKLQLTEQLAIPQAFLFFIAGFDSVATLLGNTGILLTLHPEIQEKVYQEVQEVTKSADGKITYENAVKLEYLEIVISEVLRMYPLVLRLERKCIKEYVIPETKVLISKGMDVGVPVEAIHYDEKYYPNPNQFDPERFNAENKAHRNPYTYLPFGTGPRNCIGMRLALIEAKVAIASLIMNFKLEPIHGKTPKIYKVEKNFGFTKTPQDLQVKLVPRK